MPESGLPLALAGSGGQLERFLAAARHKNAHAAGEVHLGWRAAALRSVGLDPAQHGSGSRVSLLVRSALRLEWPGIEAFQALDWRLALLPLAQLRQVLCVVGLHPLRDRVRLTVDGALRRSIVEQVGARAYQRMLAEPVPCVAPGAALTDEAVQAQQLERSGLRILEAGGTGSRRCANVWLRAAVAPAADADPRSLWSAPWQGETQPAQRLDYLVHYFPELQWLFGSPTEINLSASMTA